MALVVGFVGFIVLDPPLGVIALLGGLLIEVGELVFWSRFLARYRIRSGPETLLGQRGEVVVECRPRGQVKLGGDIWKAECEGGAGVGETVEVVSVDGLLLRVEPAAGQFPTLGPR